MQLRTVLISIAASAIMAGTALPSATIDANAKTTTGTVTAGTLNVLIPGGMTKRIVDGLQVIDITDRDRKLLYRPGIDPLIEICGKLRKAHPVFHPGQLIGKGFFLRITQPLPKLPGGLKVIEHDRRR